MNAIAQIKPQPSVRDVAQLARALGHAATVLSATPGYPDGREIRSARKAVYDECVSELREMLAHV